MIPAAAASCKVCPTGVTSVVFSSRMEMLEPKYDASPTSAPPTP